MNYPEEENPWEIDQLMHGIAIKQMEELLAVESSEERSLLMGTEGEKLTGVASLDTLVPEEELKAPLSKNQVHKND